MSLAVIECDEETCKYNEDGYCEISWVKIEQQECMTYDYDPEKDGEADDRP